MRLTLIALLLAGVVGCDPTPEEPVSEFDVTPEEPVPVDSETALVDAAEQGDAEAQYKLGFMYEGSDSVPEDYTEAAKWYRKAAEQGHVEAQYSLGDMYDDGYGVSKDDAEAVKWYRKAAEQGEYFAHRSLGDMYANGEGVPQDDIEAYARYSVLATYYNAATNYRYDDANKLLREAKAKLTAGQLIAAEKRAAELTEQINAKKAK